MPTCAIFWARNYLRKMPSPAALIRGRGRWKHDRPGSSGRRSSADNVANSEAPEPSRPDPRRSSAEFPVTLSHDDIARALEDSRAEWLRSSDPKALRRNLLELLRRLEGDQ